MILNEKTTYRGIVWDWMCEERPAEIPFSVLSTSDKVVRIVQRSFAYVIGFVGLIGAVIYDGMRLVAPTIFSSKEDSQEEGWMEEAFGTVVEVGQGVLSWLKPKEMMDESVRLQLGSLLRRLDAINPEDHKRALEEIEMTFDQIADQLFRYIQRETAGLSRKGAEKFIQTLEEQIAKRIVFNEDRKGIEGYMLPKCAAMPGMKRPMMSVAALQGFRKNSTDNVNQEAGWVLDIFSRVNKKLIPVVKNRPDFCSLLLSPKGIVTEDNLDGQEEASETSSDGDRFEDSHFYRSSIDSDGLQKSIHQALLIDNEDAELRGNLAQLTLELKEIDHELRSLEGVNIDLDDPYAFEDAMPERAQGLIHPQSFQSIPERRKEFLEAIHANREMRREAGVADKTRYQELKQERSQLLSKQVTLNTELANCYEAISIKNRPLYLAANEESQQRELLFREWE